jgi:hypothetical protein
VARASRPAVRRLPRDRPKTQATGRLGSELEIGERESGERARSSIESSRHCARVPRPRRGATVRGRQAARARRESILGWRRDARIGPSRHGTTGVAPRSSPVSGPAQTSATGRSRAAGTSVVALRSLLPRDVAPLEGRSSGSRIDRCCAPSQPASQRAVLRDSLARAPRPEWASGSMRRSSPVTATGSRRILTGFPQVGCTRGAYRLPPPEALLHSKRGTPSTVGCLAWSSPVPVRRQAGAPSRWTRRRTG